LNSFLLLASHVPRSDWGFGHCAVETKSADALWRAGHTLKGTCANLGALQAAGTALELERVAAAANLSGAEQTLEVLEDQIQRARELLDEFKQECCNENPNRR
jgi:HPt (histidine-containing phosphotransfer) domain-containing protein